MLIYQSKHPMFIHENEVKGVQTKMFADFAGLQAEIDRWKAKMAEKKPDVEVGMVFHSASNVNPSGEPCLAHTEVPTLILFARYTFIDINEKPLYLVEDMETIEMEGHTYTRFATHLATDANDKRDFWTQSLKIITDQNLIDKLDWRNIT